MLMQEDDNYVPKPVIRTKLSYKDHWFLRSESSGSKFNWVCANKNLGCPSVLTTDQNKQNATLVGFHNHEADDSLIFDNKTFQKIEEHCDSAAVEKRNSPMERIPKNFKRRFEKLPGARRGCTVWRDMETNHLYRLEKERDGCLYLTCFIKGCGKRAAWGNNVLKMRINHTHEASLIEVRKLRVMHACKIRVGQEFTPIRKIFYEEMEKMALDEGCLKFTDVEHSLYINRRAKCPRIPDTAGDFVLILMSEPRYHNNLDGDPFFRDYLCMSDGSECVIFGSPSLFNGLEVSRDVTIDASFRKVPAPFTGLLTIHYWYTDKSYPAAFILLTKYTEIAFQETFAHLREMLHNFVPENIITSYDPNLQNGIANAFPDIALRIEGSFFHYSVSLYTELNRPDTFLLETYIYGSIECKNVLEMSFALPLLMPDLIPSGMQVLWNNWVALPEDENKSKIRCFLSYIENYWINIVGPIRMSVWECPDRTNRNVEGFHKRLNKMLLTANENIWLYIERLRRFDQLEKQDAERTESGGVSYRKRTKNVAILNQTSVTTFYAKLEENKISINEFLLGVCSKVRAIRS